MITMFTSDDITGSVAAILAHLTAKNVHGSVCVKRFYDNDELLDSFSSYAAALRAGGEEMEKAGQIPKAPGEVWLCKNGLYFPPSELGMLPDFIGLIDLPNPFELLLRLTYDRRIPLKSCICNFVLDSKADNPVSKNIGRVYEALDPENFEILMAYLLSQYNGNRFDPMDNFAIRIFTEQMETDSDIMKELWTP